MDVTELVQSKWLTSQDVKESVTKTAVVIGVGVRQKAVNSKSEEYETLILPVQLDGRIKDWRLNKASLRKLVAKFGVKTEAWVGQPITLTVIPIQGGKEGVVPV
jgi:hypothetical protein